MSRAGLKGTEVCQHCQVGQEGVAEEGCGVSFWVMKMFWTQTVMMIVELEKC